MGLQCNEREEDIPSQDRQVPRVMQKSESGAEGVVSGCALNERPLHAQQEVRLHSPRPVHVATQKARGLGKEPAAGRV